MKGRTSLVLLLLLAPAGPAARAQSLLGAIGGEVTGASRRPVPGAQVTLVHEETNKQRAATSDTEGRFLFPLLPPGTYRVEVQMAGFGALSQALTLLVDQKIHLEVTLSPAGRAERVEVSAPVTPLRSESGAIASVLENRQVSGLPLDGRNFYELSLLLPGVIPAAPGSAGSARGDFSLSINGAREDSNNFLLDGVNNNDPKLNGIAADPPVDAVREFEVLTSSYDASFGRNAGGQINVVTRSGGNQWHGAAYEFFRNAALDARNFFSPASENKPKYQRNQFGASLGGPLRKDRTFFFGDYESRRVREGITQVSNVPTLLERSGDFSQSLQAPLNPFTGEPFPGNRIPPQFQHPVGAAIAALYPQPNRNVRGQNFVSSPTELDDSDRFDLRADQVLAKSTELSFRYSFADRRLFEPFSGGGGALVPGYGNDVPRRAQNAVGSLVHAFSAAWLSETRLGLNRVANSVTQQYAGTDLNRQVGLPQVSRNPRDFGLSQITVTGYSRLGDDLNSPQHGATTGYQVVEHATYAGGRSLLKFGGDVRFLQQNAFRDVESRGFLLFLGAVTQNPLGDLLLGLPTVAGAATLDNPEHLRTRSYNLFVQENFRARPDLLLNLGARYEYNAPAVDVQDRASLYDPVTRSLVQLGTGNIPRGGYLPDRNNLAPRVGLAWSPGRGAFVVRAGYGIYYDQTSLAPGEGLYFSPPYFNSRLYYSYPGLYTLTLSNPFPGNFPLPTPPTALAYQRDLRTPYIQQWNLAVQRQLGRSRIAELGYVGSKGSKLLGARDSNQPRPSPVSPNPRPVPQFADIVLEESRASSTYHSLQARFQQRLAHGISLLTSYTFSKSLDDASNFFSTSGDSNFPQDSHNLRAERGRSDFDMRQRLAVSYSCDLPSGRRFLQKGWQTAGIWTFQSGRPFTVALLSGLDNSNTGIATLGFGANNRPNRVASGAVSHPGPDGWFNTAAFVVSPYGTFGNSGRNILDGPGTQTFTLSLLKNTRLTERESLQFRAEFFNVLNRTNFDLPDIFVGSPTFGKISSAQSPRRIQFGLKLLF